MYGCVFAFVRFHVLINTVSFLINYDFPKYILVYTIKILPDMFRILLCMSVFCRYRLSSEVSQMFFDWYVAFCINMVLSRVYNVVPLCGICLIIVMLSISRISCPVFMTCVTKLYSYRSVVIFQLSVVSSDSFRNISCSQKKMFRSVKYST